MQTITNGDVLKAIKNVGVYGRKSRGETDKDLESHMYVMREICENNNWNYVEYLEIGTGDLIAVRPEMKRMIRDCDEGMYDAVLVYDYDRLGRGSGADQDTIINMLKDNEMLAIIANPFEVLNPFNESDEQRMEFKGFFARQEYKMITKRLVSGKKVRLRMGYWANGFAPYGYIRNPEEKKLEPHPVESEIYRKRIVDRYLSGEASLSDIAWELNSSGIKTRRGNLWSANAISYLLKSETHLGNIVFNTKKGKKDRQTGKYSYTKLPESDWVVVKNAHPALKTVQQHERIIAMMKKRATSYGNKNVNALTGLVKCYKCNSTMQIQKDGAGEHFIRKCDKCNNSGGSCGLVEYGIKKTAILIHHRLNEMEYDKNNLELRKKEIIDKIESLENELVKNHLAIERIEEAFEMGMYDANKTKQKMSQRTTRILEIEGEIIDLRNELSTTDNLDRRGRIKRVETFLKDIEEVKSPQDLNAIYKEFIESVSWRRPDKSDDLEIIVNFL